MTTVSGQIVGPGGTAPAAAADRRVVITLVDLDGRPRAGFTPSLEIVTSKVVSAAADGTWSADLTGNASIACDFGTTLYRVSSGYDPDARQPYIVYVSVPASGSHWVGDIRVSLPGGAAEQMIGYVPLSGGTMSGALILSGTPITGLQAATKTYVDNAVASVSGGGGGSGVSSFNARTGAVTLLETDIPNLNASVIASGSLAIARIPTGTTSSTVAIGNDARITGALQAASNLSDLASAGAGRSALGLGTAAVRNIGTGAGTAAAGDDARIVGALQAASNLSDLASAGAARVSLGLGGAALLSLGTSASTVAEGNHTHSYDPAGSAASAQSAAQTYADNLAAGLLAKASNLSDLASAGTARINLGLGGAATRNIGVIAGTAAAGDDARFADARTPLAHAASHAALGSDPIVLADIGAVPVSRQVIAGTGMTGGGTLAADRTLNVTYGTSASTAAQGNDSRITGALQAASNLSDLASAGTARTNLGLGGAALLNIGTTAGTVTAGDDSRLSNARTPTTHASTHASGGSDPITPAAIGAATRIRVTPLLVTSGDIALPNTSGAWATLLDTGGARIEAAVTAASGDWVEVALAGMAAPASTGFLDIAIVVGSSRVRYLSSGTATPAVEGDPALYPQPGAYRTFGPAGRGLIVGAGDLDSGTVRFALAVKAAGSGTLFASANYPLYLRALNLGPPA